MQYIWVFVAVAMAQQRQQLFANDKDAKSFDKNETPNDHDVTHNCIINANIVIQLRTAYTQQLWNCSYECMGEVKRLRVIVCVGCYPRIFRRTE